MIFESHSHQRFERGIPVKGLQICDRTVKIEKNINGCKGYDIQPGDGYIVSILNLDGNHPMCGDNYLMAPKPMRLLYKTFNGIYLRGYEVLGVTPFGFQKIDMSDYGITLYIENDEIVKCRLDMFDRNIYIEYYKYFSYNIMKDAMRPLQAQFVVESMSGGYSFDISEYDIIRDDDNEIYAIQQQAGRYALMSKEFILTALIEPSSLAATVSSAIERNISESIQNGKFKNNQCMKHFLELKELDDLSSHVTMLTMYSILKKVEDINNIPIKIMQILLFPESVCKVMGFYVLTICIGNPYYSINDFNKLFAYSWCEYYHSFKSKLMMIRMNGNNWKLQFKGALI